MLYHSWTRQFLSGLSCVGGTFPHLLWRPHLFIVLQFIYLTYLWMSFDYISRYDVALTIIGGDWATSSFSGGHQCCWLSHLTDLACYTASSTLGLLGYGWCHWWSTKCLGLSTRGSSHLYPFILFHLVIPVLKHMVGMIIYSCQSFHILTYMCPAFWNGRMSWKRHMKIDI